MALVDVAMVLVAMLVTAEGALWVKSTQMDAGCQTEAGMSEYHAQDYCRSISSNRWRKITGASGEVVSEQYSDATCSGTPLQSVSISNSSCGVATNNVKTECGIT